MSTSSTSAVIDRCRDVLCDRWSLAIVAASVAIVTPVMIAWLFVGGLESVAGMLDASTGPAGPTIQLVVLHPLELLLTEVAIGLGVAFFVGIDVAVAYQWLRQRGPAPRGPGSILVGTGAIAVWLGLAVAGGAAAVQTVAVPVLELIGTLVGFAGGAGTGTPVVRIGTLALIGGSVAVVGAMVPQVIVVAAIRAWRRRPTATDTAL